MRISTPVRIICGLIASLLSIGGCGLETRAETIMTREKCFDCHTIGGKGGASGPNLTRVGSRRPREYIVQQIRNPGLHKADTAMPSFNHLPEQDINAIADYLSRRK